MRTMDEEDIEGGANGDGALEVTSRLRMWWLINLKGYQVDSVRYEPRAGSFGRIAYLSTWVLVRPSQ